MSYDSLIRLRQINQPDISGYVSQIAQTLINTTTGQLSSIFYFLSNPSGYLTSGAFISQQNLNDFTVQLTSFITQNFYPLDTNPSGYLTSSTNNILTFQTPLFSGVNFQFISYNTIINPAPTSIVCTLENNVDSLNYTYNISSVNTTGFMVSFSDYLNNTGYILNSMISL